MSVDTFDPAAQPPEVDASLVRALLDACPTAERVQSLPADAVDRFAPIAKHANWTRLLEALEDGEADTLVRIVTLGEDAWPAWAAGARSSVIPIFAELKRRGYDTGALTVWIKAHSSNRFLPYGSLMDRL